MSFNEHVHELGANSEGKFCLRCGEFLKDGKEDDHNSFFFASIFRKPSVIWPTGKSKNDSGYLPHDDY